VIEDPNGSEFAPGAPVVFDPAIPCGVCQECAAGNFHLCADILFCDLPPTDGAMQEFLAWPVSQVFAIPETVDLVAAPLLEPLCVAVHATELARDLRGATVAVVGCGAVGLFTIQMARQRGAATIIATDPIPERLAWARRLGADLTLPVGEQAAVRRVDVVFEAAGPQEALQHCLNLVKPGGEVVVIGIPSQDEYLLKPSQLRREELTLHFCHRQNGNYPEAISLVREGKIQLDPILTHRFPVEKAEEAFDLAYRKTDGAVRVAVTFD
jgi:L-iditol 2-dehydrogenase